MSYYLTLNIRQDIGKRIKKMRVSRKLKQIEVATDAGMTDSYYGKIERGAVNPSLEKLYRIIRAFKCKSSDILPF